MNIKQKDLVLLPVPFSDFSSMKVRPAIVVSNDNINTSSDDVMLVPLTSVLKEVPYSVSITQDSLSEGRLITPSRGRADKIFTAEKSLIKMKIAKIKQEFFAKVKQEIINAI